MITLYGIKTCDTVRKARRWLDAQKLEHSFHDFRSDGLPADLLEGWVAQLGWEVLLNRASTTYRQLPPEAKEQLDQARASALMLEHPTLIKRPVIVCNGQARVGFRETEWQAWLQEGA